MIYLLIDWMFRQLIDWLMSRSPSERMDELLNNAFYQTLKVGGKKLELPILTSNFFRWRPFLQKLARALEY